MISVQNCAGIAAAWHIEDASSAVYYLLHGLQHRGSDGAGIACANGEHVSLYKKNGMLAETFSAGRLAELKGSLALGQVRMATAQDSANENLQPVMVRAHQGSFAIASTGMLLNAPSLRDHMEEDGLIFQGTSDAEIIAHLIQVSSGRMVEKIETACQMLKGPYSFIIMTKNTMYAALSRMAVQSLYYARYQDGYLFASETSAFGMFDVEDVTPVEPGQLIILGKRGFEKRQMDVGVRHRCSMEAVYYSREDSDFDGCSVHKLRQKLGEKLAESETGTADIVIGVPDTALSAAAAFARTKKIPYELGLIKNRYVGSTFVRPIKEQKEAEIKVRLNAISSIVRDRSVFLIDDSIQKGATAAYLCQMIKEAGAKEVHLRIASPEIRTVCCYGTEYIEEKDLAARSYSVEEMAELFGADSLRFLSREDFEEVLGSSSCMACMNGRYAEKLYDYAGLVHRAPEAGAWQDGIMKKGEKNG